MKGGMGSKNLLSVPGYPLPELRRSEIPIRVCAGFAVSSAHLTSPHQANTNLATHASLLSILYHDAPSFLQSAALAKMVRQSSSLLHFKSTFSPWDHVPAHYINCEPDRSIPPEMQRSMAAQKGMWTTNSLKKGHFPSLACPGELAGCVDAFIKEILTDSAILT